MDGVYSESDNTQPFAYLKHHDTWLGENDDDKKSSIDILCSHLIEIVRNLKKLVPKLFQLKGEFSFKYLSHLQLVLGASQLRDVDPIKNAFHLLVEPVKSVHDEIRLMLRPDEIHLFNQLLEHTTILKGFTYPPSTEEEEYGK